MLKKSDFLIFILIVFMALAGTLAYLGSAAGNYGKDVNGEEPGGNGNYTAGLLSGVSSIVPVVADSRETIQLPVLMYHGITDISASVNEYTILSDTFEEDLIWLGKNGFTTITVKQLVDYVEKGSSLPDKPVLITFDDGYANNYAFAFPLLQKYHMHAVISVIGDKADESSGDMYRKLSNSSLSWGEIALLASSGNVEIGNHTYSLHSSAGERKGANMKAGEDSHEYEAILRQDLSSLQEKIAEATGSQPLLFAWPYGEYPKDGSADEILKDLGFKVTVTSYQKINTIEMGNPDSLFGLKRFLRTPDFDMDKILG